MWDMGWCAGSASHAVHLAQLGAESEQKNLKSDGKLTNEWEKTEGKWRSREKKVKWLMLMYNN